MSRVIRNSRAIASATTSVTLRHIAIQPSKPLTIPNTPIHLGRAALRNIARPERTKNAFRHNSCRRQHQRIWRKISPDGSRGERVRTASTLLDRPDASASRATALPHFVEPMDRKDGANLFPGEDAELTQWQSPLGSHTLLHASASGPPRAKLFRKITPRLPEDFRGLLRRYRLEGPSHRRLAQTEPLENARGYNFFLIRRQIEMSPPVPGIRPARNAVRCNRLLGVNPTVRMRRPCK